MGKRTAFVRDSRDRLRDFPDDAKQAAGYQLHKVQQGDMPDDYKPMPTVGPGTLEIRIRGSDGAFRVFYVANRGDTIYVLHCFQKKSQKTDKRDIELGKQRYKELP